MSNTNIKEVIHSIRINLNRIEQEIYNDILVSGWLKYPDNKPDDNDNKAYFLVLSPNPHYIHKNLYEQKTPCFHCQTATWCGDKFITDKLEEIQVCYFFKIPPYPKR